MAKSFLSCPHTRSDGYSGTCDACGYNIHTTREQYLADLRNRAVMLSPTGVDESDPMVIEIRKAERRLGLR